MLQLTNGIFGVFLWKILFVDNALICGLRDLRGLLEINKFEQNISDKVKFAECLTGEYNTDIPKKREF